MGSPGNRVTIGPTTGSYPGQASRVAYQVELVDLSRPSRVTLDGHPLPEQASDSTADHMGWSYAASTATVIVNTGSTSVTRGLTVAESGVPWRHGLSRRPGDHSTGRTAGAGPADG